MEQHHSALTAFEATERFANVSDEDLETIFGQAITKTVCNADKNQPLERGAYDDDERPRFIRNAYAYADAIAAAYKHLGGSLEIITHLGQNGGVEVSCSLVEFEARAIEKRLGAKYADGPVITRAYDEIIEPVDTMLAVRRATIVCLLALASAPNTVDRIDSPAVAYVKQRIDDSLTLDGFDDTSVTLDDSAALAPFDREPSVAEKLTERAEPMPEDSEMQPDDIQRIALEYVVEDPAAPQPLRDALNALEAMPSEGAEEL